MRLEAVILLCFCSYGVCSKLYYHQNDYFIWNDYRVGFPTRGCDLSNTTNIPPYIVIEDQGPYTMNMTYDMTPDTNLAVWVVIYTTTFYELRLNSKKIFSFTFSTQTTASPSAATLTLVYLRTDLFGISTYPSLSITFECQVFGCSAGGIVPNITIDGMLFEI